MIIAKASYSKGKKVFITPKGEIIGQGRRLIKDGSKFNHLIKLSGVEYSSSLTYGNVNKTVQMMCSIIENYHYQVNDLAIHLKGSSELTTCENVWNFVFNHVQYKRDPVTKEVLSHPARIWLNRFKEGTPSDCDEHSILVGSLLYCLGIPFKIRIAGYDGNPYSHVYIVTQSNICVDTVLHAFNVEAETTSLKDSKIMKIETLKGLGDPDNLDGLGSLGAVDELAAITEEFVNDADDFVEEDEQDEILDSLEAEYDEDHPDDEEDENLNGWLSDRMRKEIKRSRRFKKGKMRVARSGKPRPIRSSHSRNLLRNRLLKKIRRREAGKIKKFTKRHMRVALTDYKKNPELYHKAGYSPEYWGFFKKAYNSITKEATLEGIVVNMTDGAKWERENLNPVNGMENELGETVGFLGAIGSMFKKFGKWAKKTVKKGMKWVGKQAKRGFKAVKKAAKWAVKMLKKVAQFIQKLNPIMIAVRRIIAARIKSNKKNMAIKMGYGLLTQQQANEIGLSKADYDKSKRAYASFAKKWKWLGGSLSYLSKHVKKAWYKNGLKEGLKVVKLHGIDDPDGLGQLEGSRKRRRRKKRWTKAFNKAVKIEMDKQIQLNVSGTVSSSQKAAIIRRVNSFARKKKGQLQSKEYAAFYKAFKPVTKADVYGQDDYDADKRENDAAKRKLENQPKWKKEQLAFLKEVFPSQARKSGLKGLGVVAAGSTAAAVPVATKIINWLFKMLDKIGLGKVVKKLKEKHIEKLKDKLSKKVTDAGKKVIQDKIDKAVNNLNIFNKTREDNKKKAIVPDPVINPEPKVKLPPTTPTNQPLTTNQTKVKTAGSSKIGMVVLGALVLGAIAYGSQSDDKKEEKKENKDKSKSKSKKGK